MDEKNIEQSKILDEKGIKKIIQIITAIIKLSNEGKLKTQGLNDRLGVAKEIYNRNFDDKEFIETLEKSITETMEPIYELILE